MGCANSKHDSHPTLHSGQVFRGVKEAVFSHSRKLKHKVYENINPLSPSQDSVLNTNGGPTKRRSSSECGIGGEDSVSEVSSRPTRMEGRTSLDDDMMWSKRRTEPRGGKTERKQKACFRYELEEDGCGTSSVRARSRSGYLGLRRRADPSATSEEFPSVLSTAERADRVEHGNGSLSAGRSRVAYDPYSIGMMEDSPHPPETAFIRLRRPILPLEHRFSQDFRVRSLLEGCGDMISSWKYGPFPLVNDCSDKFCTSEYLRRRRMRPPSLDVCGVDGALDVSLHATRGKDELLFEWYIQQIDIFSGSFEFFVEFLDPESRGVFAIAGISPLCSHESLKTVDHTFIRPLLTNQIHVDGQMKSCFIRLWCVWNNGFCGSLLFFFDQRFMRLERGKHFELHAVAD
jgi:hypothetical protein